MSMKKLPITDSGWFLMESRATPMHVGGLQLFDPPEGVKDPIGDFYREMRAHSDVREMLKKKLFAPFGPAINPMWTEDTDFDIEYHVRHSALPKPGRYREMFELLSRLHSIPLDQSRPLWEFHMIEGLKTKELAVYSKIHHSLMDGVAGVRLMQESFSEDPDRRDLPPMWSSEYDKKKHRRKKSSPENPSALQALRRQWAARKGLMESGREVLNSMLHPDQSTLAMPYRTPRCILNQEISGFRRLVAQTWSLARIKAVAKALGGTLNDAVLAMCSGALRQYLINHDALPKEPLVAIIPVSIRMDESSEGNAITTIMNSLATDIGDARERFEAIKGSTDTAKTALQRLSKEQVLAYTVLVNTPVLLEPLLKTATRFRPIYNVAISNVPGPRNTLYWNGYRLKGMYPFSLLPQGQALNITQFSYGDQYAFTFTACRKSLPQIQRIIDDMEYALHELEVAAGIR